MAAASFLHTKGVFMRLDKYLAETAQCTRSEATIFWINSYMEEEIF